jgi:hypothetical protein
MNLDKDLARIAYEAYCAQPAGKFLMAGDILLPFDELPEAIQAAWVAAADAIRQEITRPRPLFDPKKPDYESGPPF